MDAVAAAPTLLPAWVGWGNLLLVPLAFALAFLATSVAATVAVLGVRCAPDLPWYERARLLYPRRRAAGATAVLLACVFTTLASTVTGSLSYVDARLLGVLLFLASYAGGTLTLARVERGLASTTLPLWRWLHGAAVMWLLTWPLVLLAVVGLVFFDTRDGVGLAAYLVTVGVIGVLAAGGGIFVARGVGLARPASPRLAAIVAEAAARRGVPPPVTYELPWPVVNALAFRVWRRLAFTQLAVEMLDDDELGAFAAHELRHLEQSWTSDLIVVAVVVGIPLAALVVRDGSLTWLVVVAFVVAARVVTRMRRAHEVDADAAGHDDQSEAGTYARALERAYCMNLVPAVMPTRRAAHPHLYDRLLAAGVEPDYARPAPPSGRRALVATAVGLLVAAAGLTLLFTGVARRAWESTTEARALASLAVGGGGEPSLARLAYLRERRGDGSGALALYDSASRLERCSPYSTSRLVALLADAGRCPEARGAANRLGDLVRACTNARGYVRAASDAQRRAHDCKARGRRGTHG